MNKEYNRLILKLTMLCKQRRAHFDVKEDSGILKWVHNFIDKFNLQIKKIQFIKYEVNNIF